MRIVAITQARSGSTRFPGKVLMKIGEQTLLELHLRRVLKSKKIDELILATTTSPQDAVILEIGQECQITTYRGSEKDVLDRFYRAMTGKKADYIVRLTSDCPLIDPELIDKVIDYTVKKNLDYCSNTLHPTYPDGQDIEVFRFPALEKAWTLAKLSSEREHVTPYIWKNSSYKGGRIFSSDNFEEAPSYAHLRMTVDEPRDLELIKKLVTELDGERSWLEYAEYVEKNPEVKILNQEIGRNEGYSKSINNEKNP